MLFQFQSVRMFVTSVDCDNRKATVETLVTFAESLPCALIAEHFLYALHFGIRVLKRFFLLNTVF
jgi:hypothetical protein